MMDARDKHGRRRAALRLGVLAGAVGALLVGGLVTGGLSPATITGLVRDAGPLAPVAFVLLGATLTCLLFPGQVTATLAGALFGLSAGVGLALAVAILGAACAFLIARLVGSDAAERLLGGKARDSRTWVQAHGFGAVVASRLLPGAPAGAISYVAGLSTMRIIAFMAAVAFGALPKTVAYVALGGALHDPLSARGLIAAALYVSTAAAGAVLARRGIAGAGALRRARPPRPRPV
jgi:uncharacterized membrane protein YdjX (TVP38/TMEM64 family)